MIGSNEDFGNILDICPFGVVTVDKSKMITGINAYGANLLGYSEQEMANTLLEKYMVVRRNIERDTGIIEFFKLQNTANAYNNLDPLTMGVGKGGKIIPLAISITSLPTCDVVIFHNPADFAPPDSLTGMIQRDQMYNKLSAIEVDYALLFIDLDGFKNVNDTLGHAIGDDVLKIAADRITNTIRKNDMVCRYGGDEFIVILPRPSKNAAKVVSRKIKRSIGKTINSSSNNINISCSIGIASSSEKDSMEDIIQLADKRMYADKGVVLTNS